MLAHAINAEWIKIRTTKAVYWTTALILVFSVGFSAFMGWANGFAVSTSLDDGNPELAMTAAAGFTVSNAVQGLVAFGIMVVLIQAVLLVTGEYGNNTAKSNVLAVPGRWQLPAAKFIVYGVIAAVVTVVSAVLSVWVNRWVAGTQVSDSALLDEVSLGADDAWMVVLRSVIYALGAVALAIGVAYLLRRTAGAMAVVLLWSLVIESLPMMFPKVRDWLPQYMPFNNMATAVNLQDVDGAPWGQTGSVIYFVVICLVVFVAGVVALRRRDA